MISNSKKSDLSDQLAKLGKLHADGALSDEEFAALKAKLISEFKGYVDKDRSETPAETTEVID